MVHRKLSMDQRDRITKAVFDAIDDLNQQLPEGRKLGKNWDTVLYGRGGHLDSLQLVHLVVATEQGLEEEFNRVVVLADEKAVARGRSPFQTVGSFVEYIASRLQEAIP
jgi:acyl carrier protein